MVSHALKEKGNAANVAFGNQIAYWSGLSFDFLRCRASSSACAISTIARMSVPALSPISSILASVSSALFSSSCKLSGPVAVACRRATSPRMAVTMNPALLSPACLTSSIDSITSCGTRTVVSCDLAFLFGVAIAETPEHKCVSVYRKKEIQKGLTCVSWGNIVKHTKKVIGNTMFNAPDCWSSAEASNHNVSWSNIMACSHDNRSFPFARSTHRYASGGWSCRRNAHNRTSELKAQPAQSWGKTGIYMRVSWLHILKRKM